MNTTTDTTTPTWGLFQDSVSLAAEAPQRVVDGPKEPAAPDAPVYVAPDLGLRNPLAPRTDETEFDSTLHASLETRGATDVVATGQKGPSKTKVIAMAAMAGIATVLLGAAFLFKGVSTPAPVVHVPAPSPAAIGALKPPIAAPTGAPGVVAAPAGPATTVGTDINSTAEIATVHGDIDLLEQGRPIDPVGQTCGNEQLAEYTRAVCTAATPAKFFRCAADGMHWDPRLPGCESI